jgi:hypothetical protein
MRSHDTSEEAHEIQMRIYRSMTAEQRSELALRMSDDVRAHRGRRDPDAAPGVLRSRCSTRVGCSALRRGSRRTGLAWLARAATVSGAERFLARVVGALNGAGVPYMLTGSFASSHHGAPRATQDIDIVVDPTFDSLDRFLAALAGDDLYFDADVARDELKRGSSRCRYGS